MRNGQTFLYFTCWHPWIKRYSKISFQTHLYNYWWKESIIILFHYRTDFTTPWGYFWCNTSGWWQMQNSYWRDTGCRWWCCLYRTSIDESEIHKTEIEREIFCLSDKYEEVLTLIQTISWFDKRDPLTTIQVLSEIGDDLSVFTTVKSLVSWAVYCPCND